MASKTTRDSDLALAFYRQACFDYNNARLILERDAEFRGANALCMAQIQQTCEKALKAWITRQVGTDVYRTRNHLVWTEDLQAASLFSNVKTASNPSPKGSVWSSEMNERRLKELRELIRKKLGGDNILRLEKLENYAPIRSWFKPNTEYPWESGNAVAIPAEYFEFEEAIIMKKLGGVILRFVKGQDEKFQREWKVVIEAIDER